MSTATIKMIKISDLICAGRQVPSGTADQDPQFETTDSSVDTPTLASSGTADSTLWQQNLSIYDLALPLPTVIGTGNRTDFVVQLSIQGIPNSTLQLQVTCGPVSLSSPGVPVTGDGNCNFNVSIQRTSGGVTRQIPGGLRGNVVRRLTDAASNTTIPAGSSSFEICWLPLSKNSGLPVIFTQAGIPLPILWSFHT